MQIKNNKGGIDSQIAPAINQICKLQFPCKKKPEMQMRDDQR